MQMQDGDTESELVPYVHEFLVVRAAPVRAGKQCKSAYGTGAWIHRSGDSIQKAAKALEGCA
jgi:hypothetical protein